MKRMAMTLVGVGAVVVCVSACGSSGSEETTKPSGTVTVSEPLTVEASAQTKAEIGVAAWGVRDDGDGKMLVRGYDAKSKAIVEYRHTSEVLADNRRVDEISLTGAQGAGSVKTVMTFTPDAATGRQKLELRVEENTLAQNEGARRVTERLEADVKADNPDKVSSGTSLVMSTHPSATRLLNGTCVELNRACRDKLLMTVGFLVTAAGSCGLAVSGTIALTSCVVGSIGTVIGPGVCIGAGAGLTATAAGGCLVALAIADDAYLGAEEKCLSNACK